MYRNYLKTAIRHLRRHLSYTSANLIGLSTGLAVCFLIALFVSFELGFDTFHQNADRIARLLVHRPKSATTYANTPPGMAPDLKRSVPEIESAVRVHLDPETNPYVRYGGTSIRTEGVAFADPAFFEVFDFPLLRGNASTALASPDAVVITEAEAKRLFGRADPVGRTFSYNGIADLTVTGVLETVPENSHLQFRYVASMEAYNAMYGLDANDSYSNYNAYSYLLLSPGVSIADAERSVQAAMVDVKGASAAEYYRPRLQALTDVHFAKGLNGEIETQTDAGYLRMFIFIGLVILGLAIANYVNLSTARASSREREIGVRKALGSGRGQLAAQFLSESVVLCLLSSVVAAGILVAALPVFRAATGSAIPLSGTGWSIGAVLFAIALAAGVLAGLYPSVVLSGSTSAAELRASTSGGSSETRWIRRALIVGQIAATVILVAASITIYCQVQLMQTKNLGFDQDQVVYAAAPAAIQNQIAVVRSELTRIDGVESVSLTGAVPGRMERGQTVLFKDQNGTEQDPKFSAAVVDTAFFKTLGIEVRRGRTFRGEADQERAYVINEAAADAMNVDDPLGHPFQVWDGEEGQVVGVVENFHFESLQKAVQPAFFYMDPEQGHTYLAMRTRSTSAADVRDRIDEVWASFAPGIPADLTFLDQDFQRLVEQEQRYGSLVTFFCLVSLFLAAIGLYGLSTYAVSRRTAEIGIRKALGASGQAIALLVSREFVALSAVAVLLAWPVAYVLLSRWLAEYASRVDLSAWIFGAAGMVALLIVTLAISRQVWVAVRLNPTEALRAE